MSRVIKTESAGKDRTFLSKSIVKAIRELMQQSEPNDLSKDLAAYIALSLLEIHETVDMSVAAWEKRGYWVKADRFRLDWEWCEFLGKDMKKAVLSDDWQSVAVTAMKVGQKFNSIQISPRNRLGIPWTGAWRKLLKYEEEKKE